MIKKLINFKCCNTEILFTKRGEFKSCKCGKCSYDHGDEFYCRFLGPREYFEIKEQPTVG